MVELERRGIPTVIFTATTFVHDARRSAQSFGLAGLPLAVVPTPLTNQRPEDIHRMVAAAFEAPALLQARQRRPILTGSPTPTSDRRP